MFQLAGTTDWQIMEQGGGGGQTPEAPTTWSCVKWTANTSPILMSQKGRQTISQAASEHQPASPQDAGHSRSFGTSGGSLFFLVAFTALHDARRSLSAVTLGEQARSNTSLRFEFPRQHFSPSSTSSSSSLILPFLYRVDSSYALWPLALPPGLGAVG